MTYHPNGHAIVLFSLAALSQAQAISTSMSLPPLQWLNLTGLTTGPAPPPLKDASIGYDESSRNLLIFGGESAGGLAQSNTYLLNLDSLTWTTPSSPTNLGGSPPARSAALSGEDFAASYRHAHVIVGGKNGNTALSDVWEFDYINQFWAEVNISPGDPSPRWGASGGNDIEVAFTGSTINNTVYLAGGTNSDGPLAISDFWQLSLSGTLSSNLPNSVFGSWQQISTGKSHNLVGQAGTVVGQQVVAVSGCNTTSTNNSCALQGTYVLNANTKVTTSASSCPAPRLGATLAQNFNSFSPNFANQVFLLSGTFNQSLWDDGGGSQEGEVDVLDIDGGVWSRVLVSGDPGHTGKAAFPSAREGAATLSYSKNLVGSSRSTASDTIVFGGRDASGTYLSEIWVLRAYNDAISSSGQKWSGYGDGFLQTGVNANGAGVKLNYMTVCASAIVPVATSSSSSTSASASSSTTSVPTPTTTTPTTPEPARLYDVSAGHKVLAPASVGLLLPAVVLLRLAFPSTAPSQHDGRHLFLFYSAALLAIVAYGMGVAGLALSFTSIKSNMPLQKRTSGNINLATGHGRAGLALFTCIYGIVPILLLLRMKLPKQSTGVGVEKIRPRTDSVDTAEKLQISSASPTAGHGTPPTLPRRRVHSWAGAMWSSSRNSEESGSERSGAASPRPFEVVNRPQRVRRASNHTSSQQLRPSTVHSLGDIGWLGRPRSLNAVGELDYALSQYQHPQGLMTPATPDVRSTLGLMTPTLESNPAVEMPHSLDIFLHAFFHLALAAICGLSLAALWLLKSLVGFIVFLVWICVFYASILVLAWYGKPRRSLFTVILFRLRSAPRPPPPARHSSVTNMDQYPFPLEPQSPYIHHQPPFRAAGIDDVSTILGSPRSVEEECDDDEDDDVRQQRMEEEMARRDVSIVTVPRRKLWITNPEPV